MSTFPEQDEARAEELIKQYQPRILAKLKAMVEHLTAEGFRCEEPAELCSGPEENQCGFMVLGRKGKRKWPEQKRIDVTIRVAFSHFYDGEEEGMSFICDIVEVGGAIVGGLAPGNFTDAVWVDMHDDDDVARRWREFDSADVSGVTHCIDSYTETRGR